MRFRLVLITALALFSVTALGLPWVLSVNKLHVSDPQSVVVLYPDDQTEGYEAALEDFRKRPEIEAVTPLVNLEAELGDLPQPVTLEAYRPHVVSIPTETIHQLEREPVLLVPRKIDDVSLASVAGHTVDLKVRHYDDSGQTWVETSTVKVVGIFDQGWSSLNPNTVLASPALVEKLAVKGNTVIPYYLVVAPDADVQSIIDDIAALGLSSQEQTLSVGTAVFERLLPWMMVVAAGIYVMVLTQQMRKVAADATLAQLQTRRRFIRHCLGQTFVGALIGIALGVGLCMFLVFATFLRDLPLDAAVWAQMVLLVVAALLAQLVAVAVLAGSVWRQAVEANSLEHFAELFV